jgi:hypothetical protein
LSEQHDSAGGGWLEHELGSDEAAAIAGGQPADLRGRADSVVAITVMGEVANMVFDLPDDNAEPGKPLKLWEVLVPPHTSIPLIPRSELLAGRVLDVREFLPSGMVRRTLWRLP